MSEIEVRIVKLEPLRVAASHGFGESPEDIAHQKLLAFAEQKGLDWDAARHFGFNNPNPSPGSPNYGYDCWIEVGPEVEADGEIKIVDFPGGLYAVTRCEGLQNIGEVWKALIHWIKDSPYKKAHHQWLEELLTPRADKLEDFVFNLYSPIAE